MESHSYPNMASAMQTLKHKNALRAAAHAERQRAQTPAPAPYGVARPHAQPAGRLARASADVLGKCRRSLKRIGAAIREKSGR